MHQQLVCGRVEERAETGGDVPAAGQPPVEPVGRRAQVAARVVLLVDGAVVARALPELGQRLSLLLPKSPR